ncbi:hypothetical protein MRS44_003433 [Fusarium solani]|uniref:uncharacterized protein n=1 Tax=Fusarium solani TaxID=169388 RepID=UPI0032C44A6A|nr:hypothetical protein MRS44_003433 [Fusarium solani]
MGWPIYCLRTQLRMARGLFELCHAELEAYLQQKYSDLKPATASTLQPTFVHHASSFYYVNPTTQSKRNMDQNPCFVVISPYKSNVELINRQRKKPEDKRAISPLSSWGPLGNRSCPGFTADEQWLNVMFSRQKNGLQVVGDIDAAGSLSKDKKKKGNGTQMVTYGANREAMYARGDALRNMYKAFMDSGRVQANFREGYANKLQGGQAECKEAEIKSQSDVVIAAADECLHGQIQFLNSLTNITSRAWDDLPPTFQWALNQKFPGSFDLKERAVASHASVYKTPDSLAPRSRNQADRERGLTDSVAKGSVKRKDGSPSLFKRQRMDDDQVSHIPNAPPLSADALNGEPRHRNEVRDYVRARPSDSIRYIDLSSATVTIGIAFTNLAMRNFSVGDWDQLREIIRYRYGKAEFDVDILPVQQWMGGDVREQFGRPECTMLFLNASQLFQHLQDCHNLLHCRHPAEEAHTDQDAIDHSRRPNGEKLNST